MNKKEKVMQRIIQKMHDDFVKENPQFEKDVADLTVAVVMFNTKWGTNIEPKDLLDN